MTFAEYKARYPNAPIMSDLCALGRKKTEDQKKAQSQKLLARFQTEEGSVTRSQISDASKKMQAGSYGKVAAEHLRKMNQDPKVQECNRQSTLTRWGNGELRTAVEKWHTEHREESLASAANARRHIQKDTSIHRALREALHQQNLHSVTEYEIGYFAVDEALPEYKIAIEADGCFWHGCSVCGFPPYGNNYRRDKSKNAFLKNRGWTVFRFPEHEIRKDAAACALQVLDLVNKLKEERHDTGNP